MLFPDLLILLHCLQLRIRAPLMKLFFTQLLSKAGFLSLLTVMTSFVVNAGKYVEIEHPEWSKNATIYEVNVRQYTKEGTFKAFEQHLPRLKAMGVDILWLMPIHPIGELNRKGSIGSYYSVKDYRSVNPEFGSMEDFKTLVDKAHSMDMYVIIDWVANHSAWAGRSIAELHARQQMMVLAIRRDGAFRYAPHPDERLLATDSIIVFAPKPEDHLW